MLTDKAMRAKACALGEAVRAEDGVANAVAFIQGMAAACEKP
jgi:hypothetical protein